MMPIISYMVVALIGITVATPLPNRVIDLQDWALAIPTPSAEIKQPTLDRYSSQFLKPNFLLNGVQFTAPTDGTAQPGSSFPRTELRHIPTWNNSVGTHRIQIIGSVDILPEAFPSLVIAQVHDADRYVVIVQVIGPRIFVKVDDREVGVLDDNYQRGQIFTLTVTAASEEIVVTYNDKPPVVALTPCNGCYFKAGAYLQSRTTTPNDVGQVTIYQLKAGQTQ